MEVATHPGGSSCALEDVLFTEELKRRNRRAPELTAQNEAFHSLARILVHPPLFILQQLLQFALKLCGGGTAGISVLENFDGESVFRWVALAGKLSRYVGGSTPRNHSPCGVTLDANEAQLFLNPGRYFEYLNAVKPEIVEALVVPFYNAAASLGTIWVASHDGQALFDMEDVRVMSSLGGFAAFSVTKMQNGG